MNMFVEALSGSGGIDAVTYAPQRKKIWEMDQVFRCPVVGMCLRGVPQRGQEPFHLLPAGGWRRTSAPGKDERPNSKPAEASVEMG